MNSHPDSDFSSPEDFQASHVGEETGAKSELSPEQRIAVLQAELDRAKSREDFLRMQIEETRNKAGQAFAFQVELAQQQEETLETFHSREKSLMSELGATKKEAARVEALTVQLDGQKAELEALLKQKEELARHLEEARSADARAHA